MLFCSYEFPMSVVLFKNYRFCLALSICLPSLHALGSPLFTWAYLGSFPLYHFVNAFISIVRVVLTETTDVLLKGLHCKDHIQNSGLNWIVLHGRCKVLFLKKKLGITI
uniref:Uncharacterized protein n=1 Tax=Opuntia streptacantha TaxID=393608 RepID=A0A7C9AV17_OPUST